MAKSCIYMPSVGARTFIKLKRELGYEGAKDIFLRALNPEFLRKYRSTLTLDSDGVPTYESLLSNPYIKQHLGHERLRSIDSKAFTPQDNTLSSYNHALSAAYQYNLSGPNHNLFVAVVRQDDDNHLSVHLLDRSQESISEFQSQWGSYSLNRRMADMFSSLGVTVDLLSSVEVSAGRVGVTDFSAVRSVADGFSSMIRVANNLEGAQALSEEFSHLLIGLFRDRPLIQRSLAILQSHPEAMQLILGPQDYQDTLDFHSGDLALVAEEALGHILQSHLVSISADEWEAVPNKAIFRRTFADLASRFRDFDLQELEQAISSVENAMDTLARNIASGAVRPTADDLLHARRQARFNALSSRIDRNISILRDAAATEAKRIKIRQVKPYDGRSLVEQLLHSLDPSADTVYALLRYASNALTVLRSHEDELDRFDRYSLPAKFSVLRNINSYVHSYGSFIDAMQSAIAQDRIAPDDTSVFRKYTDPISGQQIDLPSLIRDLSDLSRRLLRRTADLAVPMFAEFLRPFFGDDIVVPFGRDKNKVISVESLLRQSDRDISFSDRWLDSMADSSDLLLQLFDAVVKRARDTARVKFLEQSRDIIALRQRAEALGITSFEWMFEHLSDGHKSGNYISPVNLGQFQSDMADFEQSLLDKYGPNPTGQSSRDKLAERRAWYSSHAVSLLGPAAPNPDLYHNPAFDALTSSQREIYDAFLALKKKYDDIYPESKIQPLRAIQQRRPDSQRILSSLSDPSSLISNIRESIKNEFEVREDDDRLFGEQTVRHGLTDFEGHEFNVLPTLYISRLQNPDELNTDIFSSLLTYSYSSLNYEQMESVVDPLEVGRDIVLSQRKTLARSGDRALIEKFSTVGVDVTNAVYKSKTNIEDKLNDFFSSQVYGKYLSDGDTFTVFGHQFSANKIFGSIMKHSSAAQLGLNFLSQIANAATGNAMINIEAFCGQFFSPSQLASADKEYASALTSYIPEIGSRARSSKLALFDDLFDIRQTLNSRVSRAQSRSLFQRIFGEQMLFFGQDAGDHWLYNRLAIAMALNTPVILDGRQTNLWDALSVVRDDNGIAYLNYADIHNPDGSAFDVGSFGRRAAHLAQSLFGIYNQEDQVAAQRVALGRLILQWRQWIKPQMNKRFQHAQYSLASQSWEEGYYRTTFRFLNELRRGQVQLLQLWDSLSDAERQNIRRTLTEFFQYAILSVLVFIANSAHIFGAGDKKRPWALKFLEYIANRELHELGQLTPLPSFEQGTPSFTFLQENLKTLKTPISCANTVQNLITLGNDIFTPSNWTNTLQSGPYKGHSTIYRDIAKAPIPIVSQLHQIDRLTNNIDNSISFYMRPSY